MGRKVFKCALHNLSDAMNVQLSNVKEILDVKVGKGGRITSLTKYEGLTVKIIVFGELGEDSIDTPSKRNGRN
jgi:small nuclear ribonucleoprotein (snRNP)-like protein